MLNEKLDAILIDFGVCVCLDGSVGDDTVKRTEGSSLYWPPEVVSGTKQKQVCARQVDMWALGVTLYNLATAGQMPFEGKSIP